MIEKPNEFDRAVWDFVHKLIPDIRTAKFVFDDRRDRIKPFAGMDDIFSGLVISPLPPLQTKPMLYNEFSPQDIFSIAMKSNGMYQIIEYSPVYPTKTYGWYSEILMPKVVNCERFDSYFYQIIDDIKELQRKRTYVPPPEPPKPDYCKMAKERVSSFLIEEKDRK
jgi:hypothetical protein